MPGDHALFGRVAGNSVVGFGVIVSEIFNLTIVSVFAYVFFNLFDFAFQGRDIRMRW